jgi:hypothetical protein
MCSNSGTVGTLPTLANFLESVKKGFTTALYARRAAENGVAQSEPDREARPAEVSDDPRSQPSLVGTPEFRAGRVPFWQPDAVSGDVPRWRDMVEA